MIIDVYGNALQILEDFVYYAKQHPNELADAMYYNYDGFRQHVSHLDMLFREAKNKQNEIGVCLLPKCPSYSGCCKYMLKYDS